MRVEYHSFRHANGTHWGHHSQLHPLYPCNWQIIYVTTYFPPTFRFLRNFQATRLERGLSQRQYLNVTDLSIHLRTYTYMMYHPFKASIYVYYMLYVCVYIMKCMFVWIIFGLSNSSHKKYSASYTNTHTLKGICKPLWPWTQLERQCTFCIFAYLHTYVCMYVFLYVYLHVCLCVDLY